MAKVFVEPIGITIEVAETETLFKPLLNAAAAIPSDCGGRGTCGKCLVRLGAGELSPSRPLRGWMPRCGAHPHTGGETRSSTPFRLVTLRISKGDKTWGFLGARMLKALPCA
jgi:hypothetical protein